MQRVKGQDSALCARILEGGHESVHFAWVGVWI